MANGDLPGEQEVNKKKTRAKQATLYHLFRYPNLRKKTLVILFSW
jgi:hypothetical protein